MDDLALLSRPKPGELRATGPNMPPSPRRCPSGATDPSALLHVRALVDAGAASMSLQLFSRLGDPPAAAAAAVNASVGDQVEGAAWMITGAEVASVPGRKHRKRHGNPRIGLVFRIS